MRRVHNDVGVPAGCDRRQSRAPVLALPSPVPRLVRRQPQVSIVIRGPVLPQEGHGGGSEQGVAGH
eukprot:5872155-Pyramimonas_sp.AAC.1